MSDNFKDLARRYEDNVFNVQHPRSIGLFPIPEYPEFEEQRGMWSKALDAILTTLRYLAPATVLTLFWGHQSFLFRLLKSIDSAFRAIVFSSEEQKQSVLQWLAEAGSVRVEHLDTVWRHGWILCGVLDAAMPGACAGHPPTRLSLKHAQAIADHYLGVEPVFSRQELESNDSLSKHQEWKLSTYLDRIRQALAKVTPPVSKPPSQRTSPEATQFTLDYVARGSGLTAAQANNKVYFKIYPTSQQSLDPGEITILIRGPKDTYGMIVLPPILGKAQIIRQKLLGLQKKPTYTKNALPITQGATYLRSYGKNDMNKTYYIPKSNYDIEIEEDIREDHIKIGYVVALEGKHEISIASRGQNIVGSPFIMTACNNIIGIFENESFCLEDGEEIDIVDVKNDRKVVLRIVDFVTEKMLLKENGSLEKISDDEAKLLMSPKKTSKQMLGLDSQTRLVESTTVNDKMITQSTKFKSAANKVVKMNQVCKIIRELTIKSDSTLSKKEQTYPRPRSHQDIPDIVNSTFNEPNYNPFLLIEKRDKIIIPENISVSLRTEKSKYFDDEDVTNIGDDSELSSPMECDSPDSLEKYETLEQQIEEDIIADRPMSSNPFLNDMIEQNYAIEKDLGSFVKTEYETNNSQNEETRDTSIKIVVEPDETDTPSPINRNPFIEPDVINLERPKTPILKIITDDVKNREDSVYIDPKTALISDEILGNEFINPFFIHHQSGQHLPITDFIIGAPVSLPPIIRATTPEPDMESILIADNNEKNVFIKEHEKPQHSNEIPSSVLSTPIHTNTIKSSLPSSTFHSLDSNISDNVDILSLSNASDNQEPHQIEQLQSDRNLTPRKDMWDSAYVSIDDSNSSPDSNNNDNSAVCETSSKQKLSPNDNSFEFSNMGPAEREIWQTCSDLKHDTVKTCEDVKPNKIEMKRPIFTPIIEESDRSISSGMKDLRKSDAFTKQTETDPVTVAFAEINDLYYDYFPNSGTSSTTNLKEDNKLTHKAIDNSIERNDVGVDSASALSDVKRHAEILEGKISEVQPYVTESVSVSQTLHANKYEQPNQKIRQSQDETQFGDKSHTNIVLERKQYWDEKIREIEAISEETKTQQRKRRLSSKHLRHNDSLTKRRGKQIVKNFLEANEQYKTGNVKSPANKEREIISAKSPIPEIASENIQTDTKLVEKWKQYWDSKLVVEKDETDTTCFTTKSPKSKDSSLSTHQLNRSQEDITEISKEIQDNGKSLPVKQELPEEVYKAFETSPKRFFGTSRKQILNKIDTFLGKPSTADESSTDVSGATPDTGLVSSRISLFHNISHTEELPWVRIKCQSMQNIFRRKDSEQSTASVDEKIITGKTKEISEVQNVQKNYRKAPVIENKEDVKIETKTVSDIATPNISMKEKRARLAQKIHNKTYDETVYKEHEKQNLETQLPSVKTVIKEYIKHSQHGQKYKPKTDLRKSSISRSEMDIFNKLTNKPCEDDLDKYKSCDELPKINVKNFISLYESVSKTDIKSKPSRTLSKTNSFQRPAEISSSSGTVNSASRNNTDNSTRKSVPNTEQLQRYNWANKGSTVSSNMSSTDLKSFDSVTTEIVSTGDLEVETTYLSLSDIELEIVENTDKTPESSPEREVEAAHIDYKSRFKLAKQFFQSLEELRDDKKPRKLNECELLLDNKSSTESLEHERPKNRVKRNIKSNSMPSSDISKIWNQLQETHSHDSSTKLVKISEKFNVDDLFTDVMEGRLSRQGSLRGIPHKKAVLEAFKSMENLVDNKVSPYEIAVTQLNDFAKENQIKNAQTYLTEYPYLPTTDPSKYHSRLDANASGLISLKELISQKPRRNSVPDLRMNTKFTVDL